MADQINMLGNFMVFIIFIFQIGIFCANFVNLDKIEVKSFKNSKVNAQNWKFFRKLFEVKRWMDGKLINVAD